VAAYRSGGGVPYERYGADFRDGQGAVNRPAFVHQLRDWLAAAGRSTNACRVNHQPRVADIGCGQGLSSVAVARAYPKVLVDGIDLDEASIADAEKVSEEAGVADRVTFSVDDAAALSQVMPIDNDFFRFYRLIT
jgi:cyclopropane fatty-acyl-phospholipid synthase-like methyltransferase